MRGNFYYGWHQVAFERELRETFTPVTVGDLSLILIRDQNRIRAVDAICPHRGANLAYGGQLAGDVIICPFHGHRVGLGDVPECSYRVRSYRTLSISDLVFVLFNEHLDNGFGAFIEDLNETHFFVQGFALTAKAPAELVVENGFDHRHFQYVHGLKAKPVLQLLPSYNGELIVQTDFRAAAFNNVWHSDTQDQPHTEIPFLARIYSPNLCVSELGQEHVVISGATPNGDGTCTIRVSVAARAQADGKPPSEQAIRSLLRDSKLAYEQDLMIWEHLDHNAPSRFDEEDDLVIAFHQYCKQFREKDRREQGLAHQVR